jgi:hypothetical protein
MLTISLEGDTSYINYIRPLNLAREMKIPHVLFMIVTTSQWAYEVLPGRMVPALIDKDPKIGECINVCSIWPIGSTRTANGPDAAERGAVFT